MLEGKLFARFEKHGDFINGQQACLALDLFEIPSDEDDRKEYILLGKLFGIVRLLNIRENVKNSADTNSWMSTKNSPIS